MKGSCLLVLLLIGIPIFMVAQDIEVEEVKSFYQIDKKSSKYGRVLTSNENFIAISTSAIANSDDFCRNGRVYIYERQLDNEWSLDTIITRKAQGMFAASLASNGKYLLIGAPADEDGVGAVYVYHKSETKWKLYQKITVDEQEEVNKFGMYVAIKDDKIIAGCGSHNKVFLYELGEKEFRQYASIKNPSVKKITRFGSAIDINNSYVFVGDIFVDSETHKSSGVVYVYKSKADSVELIEAIKPPAPKKLGNFGMKVASSSSNLAISAEDGNGVSGNVYMYNLINDQWQFQEKISNSIPQHSDCFGLRIAMHNDLLAVSATNYRNTFEDEGAIFLFEKEKSKWSQIATIYSSEGFPFNRLGWSISMHDREIVAGTFKNSLTVKDDDEPQKVYLFRLDEHVDKE